MHGTHAPTLCMEPMLGMPCALCDVQRAKRILWTLMDLPPLTLYHYIMLTFNVAWHARSLTTRGSET